MPLDYWMALGLFAIPVIMVAFVMWAAMFMGTQLDDKEDPATWGSQDIDVRIKD